MTRQQVPNVELARDTARSNLLTNGGFEIWQRGNGPFSGNGLFSADRWAITIGGADTMSVSRDTTNQDAGSGACAAVTFTGSTGSNLQHGNGLGIAETQQLRGKTVTFSVRVRTSTANAVRLRLNDQVTGVLDSAFHTGSGQYETLTLTYAVATSASVNLYASIRFAATCTAYIDNAMLVIGSVAADYAPLHPADDLARCQRYYEHFEDTQFIMSGSPGAGANVRALYYYKVRKAVTPTVTKVGTWTLNNATGQPTVSGNGLSFAWLSLTATAAGDAYAWADATGKDLTIESNP